MAQLIDFHIEQAISFDKLTIFELQVPQIVKSHHLLQQVFACVAHDLKFGDLAQLKLVHHFWKVDAHSFIH